MNSPNKSATISVADFLFLPFFQTPLIPNSRLYVSPRYAAAHPWQVERIKRSLNRPFMTDNLPQLIFDLLGVRTKYYKPASSVINDAYCPQKQRMLQVGRMYN